MAVGRPPKYTPYRVQRILAALEQGNPRSAAAQAGGIHRGTLAEWIEQYPAFAGAVSQAEAKAAMRMLTHVADAAPKDWHAAAWWLERRYPSDWARVERHELSGEGGGPLTLIVERVAGRLPAPEADDA